MMAKHTVLVVTITLMSFLSGCATWAQHGVTAEHNEKYRIAITPIEVTADIEKAVDIMTPPHEITDEQELIHRQMQDVAGRLSGFLNSKLGESNYIEPVSVGGVNDNLPSAAPHTWSLDELQSLKTSRNIQAVLDVKLSGYGKIKKKWLTYLIGTGVVEGVVQGVLAAKLVKNTWVGIAVALEEIGQEILVWGGGSYLFNEHYAPVTLEAQLISTTDGRQIWSDTVFASVDKDAIKLLPEQDRKKKELQLNLTAKKAINELSEDINKEAKSNLNVDTGSLEEWDTEN